VTGVGKTVIEEPNAVPDPAQQKRAAEQGRSLAEEARDFAGRVPARFSPADNLYDAIRADMAAIAPLNELEFQPLLRHLDRDPSFVWDHLDSEEE